MAKNKKEYPDIAIVDFARLKTFCKYHHTPDNKCIQGKNFAKSCELKKCPLLKKCEEKH